MEMRKRSLLKSLTWRVIGIIILGIITWFYTRDWTQVIMITVSSHAIRFVLYYFHERWWNQVKWGKKDAD